APISSWPARNYAPASRPAKAAARSARNTASGWLIAVSAPRAADVALRPAKHCWQRSRGGDVTSLSSGSANPHFGRGRIGELFVRVGDDKLSLSAPSRFSKGLGRPISYDHVYLARPHPDCR